MGIPRRYSHFIFGAIQSGLTSLIAAGIASIPAQSVMLFFQHWMVSWLIAGPRCCLSCFWPLPRSAPCRCG